MGALAGALAGAALGRAHAARQSAPPQPATSNPRAVLGGVIAIPLRLPAPGQGLPARVPIVLRDGERSQAIEATTVWLVQPSGEPERHWTRSANPLQVRTLPDGADPATFAEQGVARVDAAMLVADLPMSSDRATIELGADVIEPQWIEPGPAPSVDPERGATWSDDRPDPVSPFEWWRWTLMADALGELAPSPPGDAASQLMARHVAELWRAGIARVDRMSRGVAMTLRSWLTSTARDGEGEGAPQIAAWIADSAELGSLLALLLDRSRDDETVMQSALGWTDARTPITMWIAADVDGELLLAAANPLEREVLLRMQWFGEAAPPLGALVGPRSVGRIRVARPARSEVRAVAPLGGSAEPLVLGLEADLFRKRIAVAPAAVMARPPSVSFGEFLAPFSLAEAQSGALVPVDRRWATTASLRRREGRWELFAECFAAQPLQDDRLRVRIGRYEFAVRRDGVADGDARADLAVGVREFDDRWRARVVLPDAWLPRGTSEHAITTVALRRDAGAIRASAVLATPAHDGAKHEMPLIEVDLSAWLSDH